MQLILLYFSLIRLSHIQNGDAPLVIPGALVLSIILLQRLRTAGVCHFSKRDQSVLRAKKIQ